MANQVIEVSDISVVKTVNGVKQLFSLREQKVKKGGLHDFSGGSGVMYQGDLYVLKIKLEPIIYMTTDDTNFSFTIGTSLKYEVDWGDGTRDSNTSSHVYSDGQGSHDVVVYGSADSVSVFSVYEKNVTTLDVTRCTNITRLVCGKCKISTLNVSTCIELETLGCYNNRLTSLDVTKCTKLKSLDCGNNKLTILDVTKCLTLNVLSCHSCQLSALDISKCTELTNVAFANNTIDTLDVTKCTKLEYLQCYNNRLTSLDVTKCTKLKSLDCSRNLLRSIVLMYCKELTYCTCSNNPITNLDVFDNTLLEVLLIDNTQISSIASSVLTKLKRLYIYHTNISSLEISSPDLNELWIGNTPLSSNDTATMEVVNNLPARESNAKGYLNCSVNASILSAVQSVCAAKNWDVSNHTPS